MSGNPKEIVVDVSKLVRKNVHISSEKTLELANKQLSLTTSCTESANLIGKEHFSYEKDNEK